MFGNKQQQQVLNQFPLWKYIMIVVLVLLALLYALPNIYGENPAVQVSPKGGKALKAATVQKVKAVLKADKLAYFGFTASQYTVEMRFHDTIVQMKAQDAIKAALGTDYSVAINLAPNAPEWLLNLGAFPMRQGLDLRGGMYFLIDVDMHSVLLNNLNNFVEQLRKDLRTHNIRYSAITVNKKTDKIEIGFRHASVLSQAKAYISDHYQALNVTEAKGTGKAHPLQLSLGLKLREANKIRHYAVSQTVDVLRNRVNALGVAEASVSQQGLNRVVVQLPGVQDAAHAKEILGGTATIKVMMVNQSADIANAVAGHVPIGSSLYHEVGGRPTVLKNRVIVTGDAFVGASVGYDSQTSMPVVNVKLSGPQVDYFSRVTADNIGKLMAIVLVQTNFKKEKINGKIVSVPHTSQKVINEATINERLGNNFIITGIGNARAAQNLSMMIRAGALPAPIQIAESKQIGPTLGRHNIEMGEISVTIAMVAIMIFMALYYRLFGLIADFALFLNLILIVAVMSIMPGATLTLPGIAGIVLNVGMAIDANVLIFERIREEIRNGTSMQAAIHAGYARAFGTIVDSNVTTLIVALILFAVGTGAIKGFAVTLMIGIVSSMFTAITVTRGLVNVIYGKRQVKQLSIGIKAK